MNLLQVGSAALNQTPLDWQGNLDRILLAIEQAKDAGVQVLCLPELAITGYGCEDAFHAPSTARTALKQLEKITEACQGIIVSVGLPLSIEHTLYNAAAFINDGQLQGFSCKQFLAGEGVHYEPRWFRPWPKGKSMDVAVGNLRVPAGDLLYQVGDTKIGIEICEDAWSPQRPARDFAALGVDIILNPSASHFAFGKNSVRRQIFLDCSRSCSSIYIYSNLLGCESGRIIYDGGGLIANCGKVIKEGKRFSFLDVSLLEAAVDLDESRLQRSRNPTYQANPDSSGPHLVEMEALAHTSGKTTGVLIDAWETSNNVKEEEFTRAVGLGLYDYLRKSKSRGFVLSISGGLDSGGVAVLIYYMVCQIEKELGKDQLQEMFEPVLGELSAWNKQTIISNLLTCVYQSSENSGEVTFHAASELAKAIHATFHHIEIQNMVNEYTTAAEQCLDRKLSWETDDMALQNIQARVRGPSVWLLANIKNALLLTTSNRSEAAVGYATMDGDTCGGLCPIGGIDKNFLIQWMHWVEDTGPLGLEPIPMVKLITEQKPTAELRPKEQHQTDEADLMPYALLDAIECAAIRDKKSPVEVFQTLKTGECEDMDPRELAEAVKKFFRLWQRNQWKRERYAPSFHLDDKNLDPKTWCRYPILSGDFTLEFQELDALLP